MALPTRCAMEHAPVTLDDRLVDRLATRDWVAVHAAYDALADPLFRYLVSRCGERELAADVVGTTFFELVQQAPAIDGGVSGLRRWLFTAARHNLVDEQRKRQRRREVMVAATHERIAAEASSSDSEGARAGLGAGVPVPRDRTSAPLSPEEQVVAAETDVDVRRALATLPDEQREVLELRFAGGVSAAEAGEVLGRSPGAVRVLQHRALGALRQALGGRAPDAVANRDSDDATATADRVTSAPARGPPRVQRDPTTH